MKEINSTAWLMMFILSAFIWYNVYMAKISEYDENYGYIIWALVMSTLATISFAIFSFKRRTFFLNHKVLSILFFVLNSPITIFVVVYIYSILFGQFFKL
jgi:hypothetical protein